LLSFLSFYFYHCAMDLSADAASTSTMAACSSSSQSQTIGLMQLSDDLILRVLHAAAHGDVRCLGRVRRVCHRLNSVAQDYTLLRAFHWPLVLAGAVPPVVLTRPSHGVLASLDAERDRLVLSANRGFEIWAAAVPKEPAPKGLYPPLMAKRAAAKQQQQQQLLLLDIDTPMQPLEREQQLAADHDHETSVDVELAASAEDQQQSSGPAASLLLCTPGRLGVDSAMHATLERRVPSSPYSCTSDGDRSVDKTSMDVEPDEAEGDSADLSDATATSAAANMVGPTPTSTRGSGTMLAPPGKRPRLGSDHSRCGAPLATWLHSVDAFPIALPAAAEAAPQQDRPAPMPQDIALVQLEVLGDLLVGLGALGTLRVWDARTQTLVAERAPLPAERRISFSLQGSLLTLLSVVARPPLAYALMQTLSVEVSAASAPDGGLTRELPVSRTVRLLPVNTSLLPLPSMATQHNLMQRTSHGCSFTANAEAMPGTILVYPLHSREEEAVSKPLTRLVGHQHLVTDMAVHGDLLASASNRDCVCLWDMSQSAFPCVAVVPMPVMSIAITSERLFCVRGGSVLVWDLTQLPRGAMPFVGAMETDTTREASRASRTASAAADHASRLADSAAAAASLAAVPELESQERARRMHAAEEARRLASSAAAAATLAATAMPPSPKVVASDNILCVVRDGSVKVWRPFVRGMRS
jgi:CheY-like chemotaxis protein